MRECASLDEESSNWKPHKKVRVRAPSIVAHSSAASLQLGYRTGEN